MEEKRFQIREVHTKEVKDSCNTYPTARSILSSYRFGQRFEYEIYDSNKDEIVFKYTNRNVHSKRS